MLLYLIPGELDNFDMASLSFMATFMHSRLVRLTIVLKLWWRSRGLEAGGLESDLGGAG